MTERFYCGKKRRNGFFYFLLKIAFFLVFLAFSLLLIYNLQIIPALAPFASAKASTEITAAVQKIIHKTVTSQNQNLTFLQYDNNGNVVSLQTDTVKLSLLNSEITEAVINDLGKKERLVVKIPFGSLSGGALFTGKGPNISIPLASAPKITCEIENVFYESGINQTVHRIIAKVNVETYVLIPTSPKYVSVDTVYCISETVIVGKVPEAYTKINRLSDDITESEIDDIYDFGAN